MSTFPMWIGIMRFLKKIRKRDTLLRKICENSTPVIQKSFVYSWRKMENAWKLRKASYLNRF